MTTMEGHLSPYQLDSVRLGRLSNERTREAHSHLASCAACRRLDETLRADQQRFVDEVLPRSRSKFRARVDDLERARVRWRWLLVTFAPLAPAALALVLMANPRVGESPGLAPAGYQGEKGGATFFVVSRRDGRVFPAAGAGPLRAGDALRFVVSSRHRYLMIASVDGQGRSKVYAPYEGTESAPVEVDRRLELPEGGSIELDASAGPERIFALFSRRPLAASAVLAALDKLGRRGPEAVRATEHLELSADAQLSELVEKGE